MVLNNPKNSSLEDYRLTLAVEDDIELIYQWQCHPKTRKYALNPIAPEWDEHVQWMKNKLDNCEFDYFYIIEHSLTLDKVGVVRLDYRNEDEYVISIFIEPESYGKGIAISALNLIDQIHSKITISATVLPENIASQCLFRKANYKKIECNEFIRNPIK